MEISDMSVVIEAPLTLAFGLSFEDLYRREGLQRLDTAFLQRLQESDSELHARLLSVRSASVVLTRKEESELILALSPHLEEFISVLFGIQDELRALKEEYFSMAPLFDLKRKFVQRRAMTLCKAAEASGLDGNALREQLVGLFGEPFSEEAYVRHVSKWLEDEDANAEAILTAARYSTWAQHTEAGRHAHRGGVLFSVPRKLDFEHLVPLKQLEEHGVAMVQAHEEEWRHREGFSLTDHGMDSLQAMGQAHYCIKCHNQGKDSCSSGLKEKDGTFKKSVFGVTLAGCPLEEKISEMHVAMNEGLPIAAVGIITVDNPMAAGTGHRICNDCMKACIYQKQDPVDIPQAETRSLKNVLALPWGFEIYSLLTRWNPLNFRRWLPKESTGYKVLVVGLGPAGYSVAHHLMNDGHTVVAVDGLKIEPLPEDISGVDPAGNRKPFQPIRDVKDIYENLDDRIMAGFGGVAEYGITVRWDKNYLKVIRLLLERRAEFSMFGGVRFGGTLAVEDAFAMGFDHIALCAGAGKPTVIPMKNGLARGVRQASDFLMGLQLTGAAKKDSIANLQLRLPIVVIGGGLTAIDTATESLAYYVRQVKKFRARYETLVAENGEAAVRATWNAEDREIAEEFLSHAKAIEEEDAAAAREGRAPNHYRLLNSWGGSTIAYRRRLIDSPSYTLNHEEVAKALEEGIRFAECLSPVAVEVDTYGHASGLECEVQNFNPETGKLEATGKHVTLPARSILVAAGTQPNTVLQREDPTALELDGRYYRALDANGNPVMPERVAKPSETHVLASLREDGRGISFFGDLHPSFSGNVVKAMGSAKRGYPVISELLSRHTPSAVSPQELVAKLNNDLRATVHEVIRLTPNIIEVVVKAPLAARNFHPGQFYRLQNYEVFSRRTSDTLLAMEGLALTGASVDPERGLLSTIVLEMGGSSDLCRTLQPGEPIVLMGPTGTPTETPANETVLLVGGGLGNAVLFSIGQKLRACGSRVIYVAGYKKMVDRYKVDEIEKAADVIIWCCDEAPGFTPTRPQDRSFVGNIVEAMAKYGEGALHSDGSPIEIPLEDVDRMIVIGSDRMMNAVAQARHGVLSPYLKHGHHAIGSINSPMQCMMKEICAQCLQRHVDKETGKEFVVFSCFNQDQDLDRVDFHCLNERLAQNSLQEKLTRLWISRGLRELGLRGGAARA
jgi:NADPH-dependent glutamate synthase beta subunit-like oxidoreductase/NAD(P)H-flavin reductase